MSFTLTLQLLDKVTLNNNWKGLVKVTFQLPLLNLHGPIFNTFRLSVRKPSQVTETHFVFHKYIGKCR